MYYSYIECYKVIPDLSVLVKLSKGMSCPWTLVERETKLCFTFQCVCVTQEQMLRRRFECEQFIWDVILTNVSERKGK